MNSKRFPVLRAIVVALLICSPVLPAFCAAFHPISTLDGSQPSPVGGGGDSWTPVISADGRYVLFASTANNLVTNGSGNSIPLLNLPRLNVYLRDQTNGTTALVSVNLSGTGGGNGDSSLSNLDKWPLRIVRKRGRRPRA